MEVDKRDLHGGTKSWEWIKKGVPVRIEIGPRDMEKGTVALSRRDQGVKEKQFLPNAEAVGQIGAILESIQETLYQRALAYRDANTVPSTRWRSSAPSSRRGTRSGRKSTAGSRALTGAGRRRARRRSRRN